MRVLLFVISLFAGLFAVMSLASALLPGGTDIQMLAFGVFFVVLAVAVGGIGVMSRLEQIRDKEKQS